MHFLLGELPFHKKALAQCANVLIIIIPILLWRVRCGVFPKTSKTYYTLHLSDKGILYNTDFSDNAV